MEHRVDTDSVADDSEDMTQEEDLEADEYEFDCYEEDQDAKC